MRVSTLISLFSASLLSSVSAAPVTSTTTSSSGSVIKTTKITPAYWRATFNDPPLNIQGDAFFREFYDLVDQITTDPEVKVVVFDSSSKSFFSNHVDLVNPLNQTTWPGNPRYWESIEKLVHAPVLTIAAIRGIAANAGAEIAAVLDVRFASREKAVFVQGEVGFGECIFTLLSGCDWEIGLTGWGK
jgi:enoyl-CoA hydratase/carnithine racemase